MTAVAIKGSSGEPMVFTQAEATAAQATWMFHLCLSADGTDATGLTPVVSISKAGAAFAGAAGTVSEISGGWYKIVFTTVDLSTIGQLGVHVAVATADTLNVSHQVTLLDMNIATVPLATGAIASTTFASGAMTSAAFATDAIAAAAVKADAVTKIQANLATATEVAAVFGPTSNLTIGLGTLSADGHSKGVSAKNASKVVLTVTGTWGSGTAQPEVCADPLATVPVWVASGSSLTANGSETITGPVNAVRVTLSGSTSPSLVVTAEVQIPKP
jgi:hypothetical protein